jgi:BirA family transcriptional regulator, biotin operon repressor / biotin---[acetyl-CoA-carboxylase] ligase
VRAAKAGPAPIVSGQAIVHLRRTTSTNDVAAGLARQGAPDGTVVVADQQTAGRGRQGRVWLAPPRSSLLCSVLVRPSLAPAHTARLMMLAAVAMTQAMRGLGLPAAIKWPNDVLIGGCKVAGILVEAQIEGERIEYAVAGIGVNVNLDAQALAQISPAATSLSLEAGKRISRWKLLRLFLAEWQVRYEAMGRDGGQAVYQEWTSSLETIGRDVTVSMGYEVIAGRAESVDENGTLLLRRADGEVVAVTVGDVA